MKKIQVLKIKNLDGHGYLPMLRWLRHYQQEWSLPDCLQWLKTLPHTLGPYTHTDAKKIIETLTPLAEISEEVLVPVPRKEQSDNQWLWGFHPEKSAELLEAEAWFKLLPQDQKEKINVLFMRYSCEDPYPLGTIFNVDEENLTRSEKRKC